jgi:signal transduction histidine kinase
VTRIPEQGRFGVEDSLFDRLRSVDPTIPVMSVTKSTLVATSHLIESLVYEHAERCVLVSGFQHGRHWAPERDRYRAMSGDNDVIAVFAGKEPLAEVEVDHVGLRLRTGDPLSQEWFVLALGPGLAVTLCGLDSDAHVSRPLPVREADRLFDVVWSVNPSVAAVAAQVVVQALHRNGVEQAEVVATRLASAASRAPTPAEAARATDTLLAGMVKRLEATRLRERHALATASEHKSTFLSRMSHELRTPLNAILGFGQLLELDLTDPDALESVGHILTAGRHLVTLVDGVLDIGRIEAGELHLDLGPVALEAMVTSALALVEPLTAARGLIVRNEVTTTAGRDDDTVGGDGSYVLADPDRLRQVLLNLLSNAVKYNVDGGDLVVSVSRTPDAVRLSVRDSGPGMSATEVNRLFTPFERLGAAHRGIAGTGLGLVVTDQLVTAMHGHIEVDSQPGIGTTFVVALPAAPPEVA